MHSTAHLPYGWNPDDAREPNYRGHGVIAKDVLDHGFVALRNLAGPTRRATEYDMPRMFDADDCDPAQAARMSFDNMDADRTAAEDMKLCDYLMKNWHTSPFEMVECWLEMKLPIFVARQFVRHRTVSINEVSGRYVMLPEEWYIPAVVGGKPINAKQGQADTLDEKVQERFRWRLNEQCRESYQLYTSFVLSGVAPEHARMFLHLNHYTHWLWKQDLHNIMHFLGLRDHFHAQVEAQAYAQAVDDLLRMYLPGTMELYDKYRRQNARVLKSEYDKLLEALIEARELIGGHVPASIDDTVAKAVR